MKKRFSGPQIVAKLREADRLLGQGKTIEEVCKEIDVTDATQRFVKRLRLASRLIIAGVKSMAV